MLYGLITGGISFAPAKDIPDLSGKVVFITGGNVGLGKETILQLSHHNPKAIYLSARNETSANAAITAIQTAVPKAPITFIPCDLTSFDSVKSAARTFLAREKRLDILILNAGIMAVPAGQTKEGYEIQFGTNHMGHALLTKLLLPTLTKTAAEPGADVRVISIASFGHMFAPGSGLEFAGLKSEGGGVWSGMTRYGQSKLSNILFAKQFQKHYGDRGITAVAVHPGFVNTELYNSMFSGYLGLGKVINWSKKFYYTSVPDGAKTQLWAATAKLGNGKGEVKGGEYYTPVAVLEPGSKSARNEKLAEKLWDWTEKELEGHTL